MKIRHRLPLLALILLIAGCGTGEDASNGSSSAIEDYKVESTKAEVTEGDFIYRLVSEKEEYVSGGPVEIYAELEYIGEQDSIEIFHAGSAFFFPMEEKTRNYQVDYPMIEPLLITTITKGKPLRESYTGSGGYSDQDTAAYIEFMQQITSNQFPTGYYVVNGYADFYTEQPDGAQTNYDIQAEVDFKVVDE